MNFDFVLYNEEPRPLGILIRQQNNNIDLSFLFVSLTMAVMVVMLVERRGSQCLRRFFSHNPSSLSCSKGTLFRVGCHPACLGTGKRSCRAFSLSFLPPLR
jgi:hypothetical protein